MRVALCFIFLLAGSALSVAAAELPDFSREVRPILAHHCLKCHGPDDKARKGNLRLDTVAAERVAAKSGEMAIVPGQPDRSALVRRIFSHDADEVMPPPATKNPLTSAEQQILRNWIVSGAVYKEHWAFVAPTEGPLPPVRQVQWVRNPIDRFVLARLESEGLAPSPEADRATLCRRVYLDLIGLPPSPAELDAFLGDPDSHAYEKLVDQLLQSPRYGERWARRWLDLARYADTNGYEKDRVRSIWPWRDWVIAALNSDLPFDQFTIKQLAGDLLPNPTADDLIATGFHRNTMLNEEGGIDPLEFRWKAVIDRNNVTATTWLGMTLQCAQCHTHKFDPIPHREYYQMMAFFNNADEPTLPVPQPDLVARRAEIEKQIAARQADLPNRFPVDEDPLYWETPVAKLVASSGALAERLPDGSLRVSGNRPERDTYTVTFDCDAADVRAVRLEAIQDESLPSHGPGRADNGNFVLNHITVSVAPRSGGPVTPVGIVSAKADFSQAGWDVAGAIDADPKTGWAGQGQDQKMANRTAEFHFTAPVAAIPAGLRWTVRLEQNFGQHHMLGRLRLSLGRGVNASSSRSVDQRRRDELQKHFQAWLAAETPTAVNWTVLRPDELTSNIAILTALPDGSILASGDKTKRDVYDLKFRTRLAGITAMRLEVLPDDSLPEHGPGRTSYEGPFGDFFLSEMTLAADGNPVKFRGASQTLASGGNTAANAIDGNPLTGWSVGGEGAGKTSSAVFNLAAPLNAHELAMEMVFEKYYASPLGRFRISVTSDPRSVLARNVPADVETLLLTPAQARTPAQTQRLLDYYLSVAPRLASERAAIEALRKSMPALPTTLILRERPAEHMRPTFVHHRGEFLQTEEKVEPNVLSILPPLPKDAPHNRLSLARWLVDGKNPLTGRVTVNRQWAAFFGRGIVNTPQDFGYQGDPPTHPELLDWLAVEFAGDASTGGMGWSLKKLNRLIVTSATYRQSSAVTPALLEKDPQNRLLTRGARVRLEAEEVRDYALKVSELLSSKIGGPSVFPPQPASVTTEGAYGALAWNVSTGEDRYRRGLYTFMKRTAPYAMFNTFDAPSGEECLARRDVSDTPLQALTLLNDTVFEEVDQALGRLVIADADKDPSVRTERLFRRILCRSPDAEERQAVLGFYQAQKERLESRQLDGRTIAGPGASDPVESAAWAATARALLNLDETITRN